MSGSAAKATVIILTYNHERFIRQALDSVLMQKTAFDYDVVILDDASTDRTPEILRSYQHAYPARISLRLAPSNRCDNAALLDAIRATQSPLIALLDGDDYWTSAVKLQTQVDYLEAHPEWALCFHNVAMVFDEPGQEPRLVSPPGQREVSTLDDLLEGCFVTTCSALLRRDCLADLPEDYVDDQCADWSLFALAARHGTVGYVNEVMAAYRQHAGGFWTGRRRIAQREQVIQFYQRLAGRLPERYDPKVRTLLAVQCYELALDHERHGDRDAARRRLRESFAAEPDARRLLWSLRVAGTGKADLEFSATDPTSVRVSIQSAAATGFDIQLNQARLAVQAGLEYAIRFRARADRPRMLQLGFSQAHEPWSTLGLYARIALSGEWQDCEARFVALTDDDNGRIHFDAGDSVVSFEVAAVSLWRLSDAAEVEPNLLSLRAP